MHRQGVPKRGVSATLSYYVFSGHRKRTLTICRGKARHDQCGLKQLEIDKHFVNLQQPKSVQEAAVIRPLVNSKSLSASNRGPTKLT